VNPEKFMPLALVAFFLLCFGTLLRISREPHGSKLGRWLIRVLDSSFLRTRWSDQPVTRLKRMAWSSLLCAVLVLIVYFLDPTPRN